MKVYKGICIQCEKDTWIQNSKGICDECIFKNNHGGKSKQEVYQERQKSKPQKSYVIKSKKSYQYKPKKTGEYDVFLEIWRERVHECENCGMNLDRFIDEETGNPSAMLFSHKKSKGADGTKRKDKDNIDLNCPDCHFAHEHQGIDVFNKRKNLYRR